ncbi:MAG: type II toxin-antitoxin system HicB family antitoxin [Patescibacteria group bacterium]
MKTHNFRIIIEQDEDGIFVAKCPSLPGCHTQAKTYEDVVKRIEEAIGLYLEVLKERKQEDFIFQTHQPKFVAWQDLAVAI